MTDDESYTISALKNRGWTDTAIARFLGDPDRLVPNPVYRSASPAKLYRCARVDAIEQSDAYRAFVAGNAGRRAGARKAAGTKKDRLLAEVATWRIEVPILPLEKVRRAAIRSYNDWHGAKAGERGDDYAPEASG